MPGRDEIEGKGRRAPGKGPSELEDPKLREIEERLRRKLENPDAALSESPASPPAAGGRSETLPNDERIRKKREKVTGKRRSRLVILTSLVAVIAFAVAVFALTSGQFGRPKEPTPEEKKYWGRFLPKGYSEPKLTDQIDYGKISRIKMIRIDATTSSEGASVAVGDVIKNRIVYFEYQKAGADPVSLMAYIKPSGRLFVGASYCPPCQSRYQRIEGDFTITCEVCGTKRDLEGMIGISGPCKLYPIDEFPVKIIGDKIFLDAGVLNRYSPQPIDRPVGTL